jgi:hypothetical protein
MQRRAVTLVSYAQSRRRTTAATASGIGFQDFLTWLPLLNKTDLEERLGVATACVLQPNTDTRFSA